MTNEWTVEESSDNLMELGTVSTGRFDGNHPTATTCSTLGRVPLTVVTINLCGLTVHHNTRVIRPWSMYSQATGAMEECTALN